MNSELQGKKFRIVKYKLRIVREKKSDFWNKKSQLPYLFIYFYRGVNKLPYFIFSVASNLYTVIYFIFYVEHENDSIWIFFTHTMIFHNNNIGKNVLKNTVKLHVWPRTLIFWFHINL